MKIMNKTVLFDGVRLVDINGDTQEEDFCNEVELTEDECAVLTGLIDDNPDELPLYELIDQKLSGELKDRLMTCSCYGEFFTFLPEKAYLKEA